MNRTRLDTAFSALTTAQAAYDAALARVAASTGTQLPAATTALDAARTQLNAARRAVDVSRLQELGTLQSSDALLGAIAGSQVLSLFPVGLEAKLDPGRLRIRVWPDAISTSTHDPRLTPEELDATQRNLARGSDGGTRVGVARGVERTGQSSWRHPRRLDGAGADSHQSRDDEWQRRTGVPGGRDAG